MNGGYPTDQYFQLSLNTPFANKKGATHLFIRYSENEWKKYENKFTLAKKLPKSVNFLAASSTFEMPFGFKSAIDTFAFGGATSGAGGGLSGVFMPFLFPFS